MRELYEFEILVAGGISYDTEAFAEILWNPDEDLSPGVVAGTAYVDVCREANSFEEAILSAIKEIRSKAPDVFLVEVRDIQERPIRSVNIGEALVSKGE